MEKRDIELQLENSIRLIDKKFNIVESIESGFNYLNVCIEDTLLDLEATKRENNELRKKL